MVFSVSPSVTVREVDLTTVIPAIGNSPAGIAGVFHWGPVGERVLVSSEQTLATRFGEPSNYNYETFFTAADFLAYSSALYVVRVIDSNTTNAGANTAILTRDAAEAFNGNALIARYPGALGNELEISYVTTQEAISKEIQNFTISVGSNQGETTTDGINIGDVIRVGDTSIGFQSLSVVSVSEYIDPETSISTYTIGFNRRYFLSSDISNGTVQREWKYAPFFSPLAPDSAHIIVTRNGNVLDMFENVSLTESAKLDDGTNNYYKEVINNNSNWIYATAANLNTTTEPEYIKYSDGVDSEPEGSPSMLGSVMMGYDQFANPDEVDVSFILQGKAATNSNLSNYIISNVLERRRDAMLFISPRFEDVVAPSNPQVKMENILDFRNTVQNSSYWVMDSGYKYRYDKYNDVYRWVPLNGDIAGLAAKVDPWVSPAGYRKGLVRNVIKLAYNPSKDQRDQLYGRDVNPVMTQTGSGTLLFGDKTGLGTSTGSAFTRINVRRLFIVVQKAIATISAQFLFEFNDEFTQSQFKNLVDPYLRDIQGKRGIIDFRVVSDSTVNTPDVVDRNIFRGNIFIKPSRSINHIELTFIATRTGVEFEEVVGLQF